jgi:hypothetical protein
MKFASEQKQTRANEKLPSQFLLRAAPIEILFKIMTSGSQIRGVDATVVTVAVYLNIFQMLMCFLSGNRIDYFCSFRHFRPFGNAVPNKNIVPSGSINSRYKISFYEISPGT